MDASSDVCRTAFASRFSTMRSTLAVSTVTMTLGVQTWTRRGRSISMSETTRPTSAPRSADSSFGLQDAPVQTVEVEQVPEQQIQLSRVGRQAPDELGLFVAIELDVLPLERERDPEHRRERGPQFVRHRVEERPAKLIERPQTLARLSLDVERQLELLPSVLALGDHRGHHEGGERDAGIEDLERRHLLEQLSCTKGPVPCSAAQIASRHDQRGRSPRPASPNRQAAQTSNGNTRYRTRRWLTKTAWLTHGRAGEQQESLRRPPPVHRVRKDGGAGG